MILVRDSDGVIYLFNSVAEAEGSLEAVDVENKEYEACDDDGFRFDFKLTETSKVINPGQFKLVRLNERNPELPKQYFLTYGRRLSYSPEELETIYSKSSSASEAISKLQRK